MPTTRLAPSPTGALHLGNARTFLINWLMARQRGWRIVLRIDDLDGPRVKSGTDRLAMEDLQWLGLDWDEGPIYQSPRSPLYATAIHTLLASNMAYACVCSRKEVEASSSAPHVEDGSTVYPGTCRVRFSSIDDALIKTGKPPAIRFAVSPGTLTFEDQFAGRQQFDVARDLGDFVIAKADGSAAYQLAVVVDDADMGITDVVRGDDLLDSTPRQILLYRALGLVNRIPQYWHLPLVVGTDGRRLAKRHGDTRVATYREKGVSAARVLGVLARWCGLNPPTDEVDIRYLLHEFRLECVPREQIVFSARDERLLQ